MNCRQLPVICRKSRFAQTMSAIAYVAVKTEIDGRTRKSIENSVFFLARSLDGRYTMNGNTGAIHCRILPFSHPLCLRLGMENVLEKQIFYTHFFVNCLELPTPIGAIQKRSQIESIVVGTV